MDRQHTVLSHKMLFNTCRMPEGKHIVEVHLQKLYGGLSELVLCGVGCTTNALRGAKSS